MNTDKLFSVSKKQLSVTTASVCRLLILSNDRPQPEECLTHLTLRMLNLYNYEHIRGTDAQIFLYLIHGIFLSVKNRKFSFCVRHYGMWTLVM